jgi:hypothetical protein
MKPTLSELHAAHATLDLLHTQAVTAYMVRNAQAYAASMAAIRATIAGRDDPETFPVFSHAAGVLEQATDGAGDH